MKWATSYKWYAWLIVILFIAIISCYAFEFWALGNTVSSEDMITKACLVGAVIGLSTGYYFQRKWKPKEAVPTIRMWLTCLLVPIVFAPLVVSLINRKLSPSTVVRQVEFIESQAFYPQQKIISPEDVASGFYLFVYFDGNIERFRTNQSQYLELNRGDIIRLELHKGVFGYEYFPLY